MFCFSILFLFVSYSGPISNGQLTDPNRSNQNSGELELSLLEKELPEHLYRIYFIGTLKRVVWYFEEGDVVL